MFKYEINFSFSLWKYLYTTNLNIFFPMLRVSTEMIGIIKIYADYGTSYAA